MGVCGYCHDSVNYDDLWDDNDWIFIDRYDDDLYNVDDMQ